MRDDAEEITAGPTLYMRVQAALTAVGCDIGAAECHGMLCGMLCGPGRFDRAAWLGHVNGDEPGAGAAGSSVSLDDLVEQTQAELAAPDFSFALLLPADDTAVSKRAAAFADWCRGYLSGLGLAGIADLNALGEDAIGFLRDVERFCALEAGDGDDDDRALAELTEFTRMGVLLVREQARAAGKPDTLH